MADNISFDDLIPSKQTDKSAPSKGADISFDDLIPKQAEARPSTTSVIEGKGGAAFGIYPKASTDQEPTSRIATNIGRTATEAVIPTGAGLAGFGGGMAAAMPVAAAVAPLTGPFAPVVAGAIQLAGGFGGALVASGAAKKVQDMMHEAFAPEDFARRQAEKKQFPGATFVTELGVGMAGMSPKTVVSALSPTAGKFTRLASTETGQRVISGGLQGGIEAGTELASEGTITPWKVGAATAAGAAMPGFNVAGRIPFALGTKVGEKIGAKISTILPGGADTTIKTTPDPLPPKPPEGATPEERAVYIQKLETIKAERDAKAPLTETAIRNKETGAIERMGPKHDEQRKLETADTHDQGFVDERGNFLTRQEAIDRAKNTEQLPKDYMPENPEVGLRSEDLRKAGDKRFELPVAQDVNAPPPKEEVVITEKPTENKDYYRQKLASLEQVKVEVLAEVEWAKSNNDAEYQARMEENLAGVLTDMRKQQSLLDAADMARSDVKKAIEDNKYKRVELELEAEKFAAFGNELRVTSINEQIKQLETEHAQLYKDMPPVKFENSRKPTWQELQDHLYGTKTIGEAFDRILATKELGRLSQRVLIKALNESSFIRDAKLEFYDNYLAYQDKDGNWQQDGAGLYTGGDIHLVQMGEKGDLSVLLHESIHAGTQRLLSEQGSTAAIKMQELFDKYNKTHGKEIDPTTGKPYYGFENVHEFAAEAFTSKPFQKLLAGIQVGQQPKGVANNIWAAFKETVRKGLRVPEGARTAFDEVMDQGISLVKQSKDYTPRPDFATSVPSKASDKFVQNQEEVFWNKVKVVTDAKVTAQELANKTYEAYKENPSGKTKLAYTQAEKSLETAVEEYNKYVPTNEADRLDFLERKAAFEKTKTTLNKAATTSPSKPPSSPDEPSKTPGVSVKSMLEKDKTAPVDRTKTDPRDVKDEKEFYEIATDIYEKHGPTEATRFYEGYREYKKTWLEPIKETEKFVGINIKNKLANDRIIHNEMGQMQEVVPDPARREAIAVAVDKGDLSGLSPTELAVAKQYESLVKDIGDRAVKEGVVKGLLEDYVTHILDWRGAPKGAREEFIQSLLGTGKRDPAMGGMTTESKFGKERKFKTFADLEWYIRDVNSRIEAAGKSDWRLEIKTKDIAQIYKEYATSMEKAIENKKLVDSLKQVRNVNGETLIKEVNKDNPMPYGWEMMDSPQFAGYAVHPDLIPALRFVFDSGPGDLMNALGYVSQLTKRINVIGSFFHAKSLIEVLSSTGSAIPLWTPTKEITLGGIDKLLGTKYSGITKALDQFKKGGLGDNVDKWIKEGGLVLEVPEDVAKGILSSTGKFADSMISKYGPKTRVLESSLSAVEKATLGIFDKITWDFLHTGGKIMVADAYLGRARMEALRAGKPFDEVAARKEISSFVNDSFGGLNWFEAATQTQNEFAKRMAMAAYSPAGRRGLQIMLFAPDWTLSTLRAFTAALPKGLNPTKWNPVEGIKGMMTPTTKADYARLYQFKTAIAYITLVNTINLMVSGRPAWENKDPTRIEFPDGTSMQAMKHAMEPAHWIMDPTKTLSNKLGFIPKAAIIYTAGTEYASPQAPKLVDPSMLGRTEAVLKGAVPFQVSAAREAPEGEGAKRALLGTLGFPLYGGTKEQKKEKRAERELLLKENAWKYRNREVEAGREPLTSEHTKQGEMLRKRRQEYEKKKAAQDGK
jgi:hypothetical protein